MIVVGFGVAKARTPTTTTLASSPNPSVAGQAVTFTATVTPAVGSPSPVGTVTALIHHLRIAGERTVAAVEIVVASIARGDGEYSASR